MVLSSFAFSGCKGGAGKTAAVLLKVEKVTCKVGTTICAFINSYCSARSEATQIPLNDAMVKATKKK